MYTQITKGDIYKDRGVFRLLFGTSSLADTAPLRELLVKYVTAETLKRVAEAYDDNRLLFVGTTNIDYGQTWIWNMSLIAKAGDLKLYRNVLLASASFPIVFPPVDIDGHLFVDGAARSNLVVPGMFGGQRPNPPLHGAGNLYLIDNGKVTEPPEALVLSLGRIAAQTISVMMEQSMAPGRSLPTTTNARSMSSSPRASRNSSGSLNVCPAAFKSRIRIGCTGFAGFVRTATRRA